MRKAIYHGSVQQALRLSSKLKGSRRYNAPPASRQGYEMGIYIGRA